MTREEAIEKLKACQADTDTEMAHANADRVLCQYLATLGHRDVVEEWHKVKRWYA